MLETVDMHIHIHPMPTPENGLRMPDDYRENLVADLRRLGIPPEDQAAEAVRRMDRAGVDAAMVVNPYHEPVSGHVRTNKSVADTIAPFRGRLFALAGTYLHPEPELDQLEYAIKDLGFRGLKINVGSQQARPADFELLDPLYQTLIELDAALLVHPGPGFHGGLDHWGYEMRDYYEVARRYPELRLVIAHGGSGTLGGLEMAVTVVSTCHNVYLEVSGLLYRSAMRHMPPVANPGFRKAFANELLFPLSGRRTPEMDRVWDRVAEEHTLALRELVNRIPFKLMYGTDIPLIDRWDVSVGLYRDAIPDRVIQRAVMAGTAVKVFKLDQAV